MEKLNRAQKCSILGPQNLGSGGPPLGPHLVSSIPFEHIDSEMNEECNFDKNQLFRSILVAARNAESTQKMD